VNTCTEALHGGGGGWHREALLAQAREALEAHLAQEHLGLLTYLPALRELGADFVVGTDG